MNKFKLGIITFVLLGFAACEKDDNALSNEDNKEEVFITPIIKEITSTPEGDNDILIKLIGSGFGTRLKKEDANAPFAPLLSSDFEHDNNGDVTQIGQPVVESLSQWSDRGAEERPAGFERRALFSDVLRSDESTNNRSIKMTHKKVEDGDKADPVIVAQNLDFKKTRKIFFSYWVKFKWPNENPDSSYQYKLSTVATDISQGGSVHAGADMQFANWMYPPNKNHSKPYTGNYYRNKNGSSAPQKSNTIYFPGNTLEPSTDNWRNVVLFWNPGTAGELDGKLWSWISKGTNIPIVQKGGLDKLFDGDEPMLQIYDKSVSDFPNSIKLAWYISKLKEWNVDTYFDDVVADNSWAQIFVGDKPDFDDCSTLELQQVADWQTGQNGADDEVQFILRYGSLAKDVPLYVYIMNEGGLYNSAGFKILQD